MLGLKLNHVIKRCPWCPVVRVVSSLCVWTWIWVLPCILVGCAVVTLCPGWLVWRFVGDRFGVVSLPAASVPESVVGSVVAYFTVHLLLFPEFVYFVVSCILIDVLDFLLCELAGSRWFWYGDILSSPLSPILMVVSCLFWIVFFILSSHSSCIPVLDYHCCSAVLFWINMLYWTTQVANISDK